MIRLNTLDQMPATMPCPYNGTEVSNAQLEKFISASVNQEKLPMVILGANWCADAQYLEAIMQLPSVAQFIAKHYEVIRVDLGEYDINMDLIKYLGMPSQEGIPRVFILDLQGEPINLETNDKWRSARQSYPQDIFDYFQSFIKKRPST
jgi:thioredoxin 1